MSTTARAAGGERDAAAEAGAAREACAHCGLPVPAARAARFCCDGCEIVAAALAANGLDRWYELRERSNAEPRPARTTGRTYAELDDPAMGAACVPCASDGLVTADLYLEGVHCAACVWLVERLPSVRAGVVQARLDFGRARASVTFDPARVRLSEIARTLDSLGYPVHPWRGASRDEARRREDRLLALRLGVAGACAANAMTLAAALYAGHLTDMEPGTTRFLRLMSFVVSLPSATWAAWPFYRGAWASLRARVLHVDLPLAMAIAAALLGSAWHVLRGSGEVYFDSLTALVFLLLFARWLNRRATRAAESAGDILAALAPSSARIVVDGAAREVPVETLRAGDLVEIRAGDSLPADGIVEEGASSLDLSLLSGESRPRAVGAGDRVHAGTLNVQARLLVRVESTGEQTRLGKLAALVQAAVSRRAPVLRLVDRLAGSFVAVVLSLAALTLAVWWRIDPERAMENALAMLIVTCPCVLAFATPLAVNVALGRAARRGLLIKGGDALEALKGRGIVVLDKTGTLTQGRVALVSWCGDDAAKPLVRALEAHSAHPLALALVKGLAGAGDAPEAVEVTQALGDGIAGRVGAHSVAAGSRRFAERLAGDLPGWATDEAARLAGDAVTPVFALVDGAVVAVAGLGDPLREDAASSVTALRARGWEVRILSGDEPAVVAAVARRLGLPADAARGGVSPEGKADEVRELRSLGPVLMAGDGVNDAAALAAADVGLAVAGGAEASLAAADAFTTRPGLTPVVELVDGSRGLARALRANACVSVSYNVVGAGLCMAGLIGPLAAALLMPASSLMVTVLSLRWPTFPKESLPWR